VTAFVTDRVSTCTYYLAIDDVTLYSAQHYHVKNTPAATMHVNMSRPVMMIY